MAQMRLSSLMQQTPENFLRNNDTGATYDLGPSQNVQGSPQMPALDYSSAPVEIGGYGKGYRLKGDPSTVILSDGRMVRLGADTGADQARQMAQLKLQEAQQKLQGGGLDQQIKQAQLDELMGIDPSARAGGGFNAPNQPIVGYGGPIPGSSIDGAQQPLNVAAANQRFLRRKFGDAPAGYRRTQDGGLEIEPGGPADMERQAAAQKDATRRDTLTGQAESVLGEVAEAKKLVDNFSTGFGGLLSNVPMTDARKLAGRIETIKANLGFDRLQQMRDMSPTGGALGQVAVQELNALRSTVTMLDQLQSPSEVKAALDKIDKHYSNWKSTLGGNVQRDEAPKGRTVTMQDIMDTAKSTGKDPNQIIKDVKAKGYTIGGM